MLELGYIVLLVTLLSVISFQLNKAFVKQKVPANVRKRNFLIFFGVLSSWFVMQHFIIQSQFYHNLTLPPRIVLCIILPLFIFTGLFLYRHRNNAVLHSIPIEVPILYQSFRAVIEVLFYFSFVRELLPVHVTFEGYNMDILLGISAIPMFFYSLRKTASKKVLIAWNVIGIFVVGWAAFVFTTTNYFPQIWGYEESIFPTGFLRFPFMFLPCFFMPSAIFVHVLSIVQLTRKETK